jgi:hypothetical protein
VQVAADLRTAWPVTVQAGGKRRLPVEALDGGLGAYAAMAGFPDPQVPATADQVGEVGGLVVGIFDTAGDVDDRLGCEAGTEVEPMCSTIDSRSPSSLCPPGASGRDRRVSLEQLRRVVPWGSFGGSTTRRAA